MTVLIEQLLQQRIGMDIRSVGRQTLQRVLSAELQKFSCNLADYQHQLPVSEPMWTSLVEAMVVPETWFFRYPESFRLVAELASHLLTRQSSARLAVLCLPCSTGEEPYSLAITLMQQGYQPNQFQIDALDINTKVLAQAEQGLFRDYSFRGCPAGLKERYFTARGGQYQIHPDLRQSVSFRYGNLLDSSTLPQKKYHLVFCRNLLIYFDQNTQQSAVRQLRQLMLPDGYLFSGPAETGAFLKAGMTSLTQRDSFAFANPQEKNRQTAVAKPLLVAVSGSALNKSTRTVAKPAGHRQKPGRTEVLPQAVPVKKNTGLLEDIEQQANQGQLTQALALCQQALTELGPSARLFYVWGLLSDSLDQKGNAEMYYRKALYIEPLHTQALKQLTALLRAQNDHAAAERFEQRLTPRK
ncbi:protein-glutamate O-methyltransferase CheR [Rheinheimera sp.]|uniref:CheR family methyltransferase n=1 Tax=Rheinheimera sp. TaxID=1869214 RepID=UPI00307CFBA8